MNIKLKIILILSGIVFGGIISVGIYANISNTGVFGAPTKVDISTQTNLAADSPLFLTNDTLSVNLASSALNIDSTASISGAITFGNLISCDTIDTNANGLLSCGTDATGAGGNTFTNPLSLVGTVVSIDLASASGDGYLSAANWTTFNNKQAALTFELPLVNVSNTVSASYASAADSGWLSSTDWTTFNAKQAAGDYITALTGDVTATGPGSVAATIAANSVALTTDTTGNYVLSIADDGTGTVTVINGAGEGLAATLKVVDVSCTDCLNATEIEDIYFLTAGDTATWVSVSADADIVDLNATSASFGTITLPADAITEANINFSTACATGNHYYLSGTNLACEADANTTYTATNPLSLVGTAFSIDVASAGGAGAISVANWETFNEKISSLSIDTSAELITIVGDETGSGHIVFDTSPELTTSFTTTGVFAINPGGTLTIGDGGDTLVINSSDWDIDATGIMTGIGAITADGLFSGTHASLSGDLDISGDLNVASATFGGTSVNGGLITSGTITANSFLNVASSAAAFGGNVDFYSTASTSSNFDFNSNGLVINIGNAGTDFTSGGGLNIAGVFALGTDQLWTTVATGNLMSSHSWQFSTGQSVEFDGTASTSGNWTANNGVWDLGSVMSFEFPNSTALTLDSNGEAYIDTTAGQFQYYSDETNVLMASTSQGFGIKISSTAFDLTTGGDTFVGEPGTIIGYGCSVTGGTNRGVEIIICDGTTCGDGGSVGTSITAVATGITFQDAVTSGTFAAWDEIKASTSDGDMTGTVQWIKCRIFIKPSVQ